MIEDLLFPGKGRGIFFQVDSQNRQGSRGDAGNAGGLPERPGPESGEFFRHLPGEAGDVLIFQFRRDPDVLGSVEPFDLFLLTFDVAGVFQFNLEGFSQARREQVEFRFEAGKMREGDFRPPKQVGQPGG